MEAEGEAEAEEGLVLLEFTHRPQAMRAALLEGGLSSRCAPRCSS